MTDDLAEQLRRALVSGAPPRPQGVPVGEPQPPASPDAPDHITTSVAPPSAGAPTLQTEPQARADAAPRSSAGAERSLASEHSTRALELADAMLAAAEGTSLRVHEPGGGPVSAAEPVVSSPRIHQLMIRRDDESIVLSKGSILLGRSVTAFAPVDDDRVSRRHAQLTADPVGDALLVIDLGSRNGTTIVRGGERHPVGREPVVLQADDQVITGHGVLLAQIVGKPDQPASRQSPSQR